VQEGRGGALTGDTADAIKKHSIHADEVIDKGEDRADEDGVCCQLQVSGLSSVEFPMYPEKEHISAILPVVDKESVQRKERRSQEDMVAGNAPAGGRDVPESAVTESPILPARVDEPDRRPEIERDSHTKAERPFTEVSTTGRMVAAASDVTLNFNNADIYQVVQTIASILGINYVIDPAVKGTVNVHTKGKITKEDLFEIFIAILRVNGAAIIKQGELYHVIPVKSVKTRLLIPRTGSAGLDPPVKDDVVLQVIKISFIPVKDVVNILKPFISPGGDITPFEKNNILLLTDFATNIVKLTGIVDLIDVDIFKEIGIKLFPIEEADVRDISQDMEKIFSSLEVPTKSGRGAAVSFLPIPRINSLLVISSLPNIFEEVQKWLVELDRNISQDEERTFIYHVKNGIASELSDILNAVFAQDRTKKPQGLSISLTPSKHKTLNGTTGARKKDERTIPMAEGSVTGDVKVIPYATTNTIIIKATPRDYQVVKNILDELDIIPRQVLIEILVAEVTLTDDTTLGIEYMFRDNEVESGVFEKIVGTSLGLSKAGTLATGGFTASVVKDAFLGTINALASSNRLDILASPHIIATDGKEASIDIGDEVPLVASKIFIDQREEITIERRNTGVILKVTPHINNSGLVTLDLSLELSNAAKAVVEGESDIRIFQRNAKTTMVVHEKQTILIGGLINKKDEVEISKVPLLGDIPLLGALFTSTKNSVEKTELVLLMTPHLINDTKEANDMTENFMKGLRQIRELLGKDGLDTGGQ
jgi:general secretion pathway protein D